MALASNALIDTDYLTQMTTRTVDAGNTAFVEELINQASDLAEQIARRKLASQTITEVYDGNGGYRLVLKQWPITGMTGIYIDADRVFGATTEITDYYLEADAGIVHYDSGFGRVPQSVKVIYVAGYSTVPSDLKEAVVELVLWLWTRQNGGNVALRVTTGIDGVRTEHEISIPMNARVAIERYMDRRV